MNKLTATDIKIGKTYRAKRPTQYLSGEFNDRTVIYIGLRTVQYDGPAVKIGQRYPEVSIEKFLKWAGYDVTGDNDE